jgi:hypothetical protein
MTNERVGRFSNRWRVGGRAIALAVMMSSFALLRCGGESSSQSKDDGEAGSPSGGDTLGGSAGTDSGGTSTGGASGTGGVTAGAGGVSSVAGGTGGVAGACPEFDRDRPFTVELTLDAYCAAFDCSTSLDEALRNEEGRCTSTYGGLTVTRGCGLAELGHFFGYGNSAEVFDATTGELVGASQSSDVSNGPCGASGYRAGVEFPDCTEVWSCDTCSSGGFPLCRAECDCPNVEVENDPCFLPDSCGCYCVLTRQIP